MSAVVRGIDVSIVGLIAGFVIGGLFFLICEEVAEWTPPRPWVKIFGLVIGITIFVLAGFSIREG